MRSGQLASVYILTNKRHSVLYTGVTNDLIRRMEEHKGGKGFVKRYNLSKLVYFEVTERIDEALEREKQIKGGSRKRKVDLINSINPHWNDLLPEILGQ